MTAPTPGSIETSMASGGAPSPDGVGVSGSTLPSTDGKPRLGDLLVAKGLVNEEQLKEALQAQKQSGKLLGEAMAELGLINTATLVETLSHSLGVPGCQLRPGLIDPAAMEKIGLDEAKRLNTMPLFFVRGVLTVAMAEPQQLPKIDRLRQLAGCEIRPVFALKSDIQAQLARHSDSNSDIDHFLTSLTEADVEIADKENVDDHSGHNLDQLVEGSPIINVVNVALLSAIKDKASDIHIEPDKSGTRIRYRIDGVLRDLMKPPPGMHAAIVSRIKVIGKMDIAERRLPQEGRVRLSAEGRDIDVRVSSIPTLLGEKLVMRILDKGNLRVEMEDLGFRSEALSIFRRVLTQPHGLILVTGPTGSGKTTTLYSALDLLRNPEVNIVTVEDPVEYQLDLINQIQVQENIGMSFARALRSILRQDPDVIMIGEIRDEETARVAVQAALTGHLVLATLHTNDAPGAVTRLLDMGIEPYLLSSALNGVVAQRLARTICPHCLTKYFPTQQALEDAGVPDMVGRPFQKGSGCRKCHNSGMLGRHGIYEVMEVSGKLRRLVHRAAATHELRDAWRDEGGMPLREEGVQVALQGICSLEEVLRVTHNEDAEAADPAAATANTTTTPSQEIKA